jgi:hypothetical protein
VPETEFIDRIPRQWHGDAVVIIASGPSLCDEDIEIVRQSHEAGNCRVIVVNNNWERAPWADALYACDGKWWRQYQPDFAGQKWAYEDPGRDDVTRVRGIAGASLGADPSHIKLGNNSGFQAINLAYHFGCDRIVLLGFDMQGGHWHAPHRETSGGTMTDPSAANLSFWRKGLHRLAGDLSQRGVRLINASRETALKIERMTIVEALHAVTDRDYRRRA